MFCVLRAHLPCLRTSSVAVVVLVLVVVAAALVAVVFSSLV